MEEKGEVRDLRHVFGGRGGLTCRGGERLLPVECIDPRRQAQAGLKPKRVPLSADFIPGCGGQVHQHEGQPLEVRLAAPALRHFDKRASLGQDMPHAGHSGLADLGL